MRAIVDNLRPSLAAGAMLCVVVLAAGWTTTLRADTCGSYLHSNSDLAMDAPPPASAVDAGEPVAPAPAECHGPRCQKGAPRSATPTPPAPSSVSPRDSAAAVAAIEAIPPTSNLHGRPAPNESPIIVVLDQLDPPPR